MNTELAKKVVLVTGSNRGIGKALVGALARTGDFTVILTGRSLDSAKQSADDLREDGPDESIVPKQLDVEDEQSIEACAAEVEKEYGRLDALVNNAGRSRFRSGVIK